MTTPEQRRELLELAEPVLRNGQLLRGTAEGANLVAFDGHKVAGIGAIFYPSHLDYIAAACNLSPALVRKVDRLEKAIEAAPHAKGCKSGYTYHDFWLCSTNKSGLLCDVCDEPESGERHRQSAGLMPCNCWKAAIAAGKGLTNG